MKDIILSLSGGLDSSSLLFEYKDRIKIAVSFVYGSNHANNEIKAAKQIIEKVNNLGYNIEHKIIDLTNAFNGFKSALLSGAEAVPDSEYNEESISQLVVPFRNGIFLSILAGLADSNGCKYIALANHSGDHCFTENTKFYTPHGIKTLNELNEGDEIFSFNTETNKIELDKVNKKWCNGTNNEIFTIKTNDSSIELTGEHIVYRLRSEHDNIIEKVHAKELKIGDFLVQLFDFDKIIEQKNNEISTSAKFAKITGIDIDCSKTVKVYDIEVEKNHNFFAGSSGNVLISNSVYHDCRPEFIDAIFKAISLGTSNEIEVFAPYTKISKGEIALRGIKSGLNPEWTYSCYKGGEKQCGKCPTCIERINSIKYAEEQLNKS